MNRLTICVLLVAAVAWKTPTGEPVASAASATGTSWCIHVVDLSSGIDSHETRIDPATPGLEVPFAEPGGAAPLGIFLMVLAVIGLAVTGLATGLLLRGRPLHAGCRGMRALERLDLRCGNCGTPCTLASLREESARVRPLRAQETEIGK